MNPDIVGSAYRVKQQQGRQLTEDQITEVRSAMDRTGDGHAYELATRCVSDCVSRLLAFCQRSIQPLVNAHLLEGDTDVPTIVARIQTEFLDNVLKELPGGYLYASVRGGAAGLASQARHNSEESFLSKKATLRASVADHVTLHVVEWQAKNQTAPNLRRPKDQKFGILDSPALLREDLQQPPGALGRAIVYFDVDHFKAQNTRFTERVVDEFVLPHLQRLVTRYIQSLGHAYAEGGDEMVLLLPNATVGMASDVACALRGAISEHVFDVKGTEVRLSASFGVAGSSDPSQDLVADANLAKQFVKENGRDGVAVRRNGTSELLAR